MRAFFFVGLLGATAASAQDPGPAPAEPWHFDLAIANKGVGLGHSPHIDGLRINFRDQADFTVHGMSITVWAPSKGPENGGVYGLALGLPSAAAPSVWGLAVGPGVLATNTLNGLIVGLGVGAGQAIRGVTFGALGVGAGKNLSGVTVAGLGAGTGGAIRGLGLAGLGLGSGESMVGVFIGGLGVGSGDNVTGIAVGGLGVGAGKNLDGLFFGGLGLGAGGRIRGLAVATLGIGAGESIEGFALSVGGIGSPLIRGFTVAPVVISNGLRGVALAPLWFESGKEGALKGVSFSVVNRIRGVQRGLCIGIVNLATELHGVQIGLINYAGNNQTFKVLPVVNAHFD
jgi:hypothetical protein